MAVADGGRRPRRAAATRAAQRLDDSSDDDDDSNQHDTRSSSSFAGSDSDSVAMDISATLATPQPRASRTRKRVSLTPLSAVASRTYKTDRVESPSVCGSASSRRRSLSVHSASSSNRIRRTSEMFEAASTPGSAQRLSFIEDSRKSPSLTLAVVNERGTRRMPTHAAAPPPKLDLGSEELRNSFEAWMKIATDNKITANNTWNLALIDYFHDMTVLRDGDEINFQKASCTLDGCVKIYTSRIDSVDAETKKFLNGLISTSGEADAQQGSDNSDDDDDDANENGEEVRRHKPSKRSTRSTSTLEADIENLNFKKLDIEFMVDPLFKKTSVDFDEGGARGLLLNHLSVDNSGKIVFDSSDYAAEAQMVPNETILEDGEMGNAAMDVESEDGDSSPAKALNFDVQEKDTANQESDSELKSEWIDMSKLSSRFPALFQVVHRTRKSDTSQGSDNKVSTILDSAAICAPLRKFEFNSNTLDILGTGGDDDDGGDSYDLQARLASDNMLSNFQKLNIDNKGLNVAGTSVADDDNLFGFDGMDDYIDYDENNDGGDDGPLGDFDEQDRADDGDSVHHGTPTVVFGGGRDISKVARLDDDEILGMIGSGFQENNVFSYLGDRFNWAGPAFWKKKRSTAAAAASAQEDAENAAKSKRTKKQQVVPNFFEDEVDFLDLDNNASHAPTLLQESKLYISGENILEDRKRFSAKDVISLFLKPDKLLKFVNKDGTYSEVDINQEVDDRFLEDYQGELRPDENTMEALDFGDGVDDQDDDRDGFEGFGYDDDDQYYASQQAPQVAEAAESEEVNYCSQLVEKPKVTTNIPINFARVAKRVDIKKLKKNIWKDLVGRLHAEMRSNGTADEAAVDNDEPVPDMMPDEKPMHLKQVVRDLDGVYADRSRKDISVAFCFVCLLHLANEHDLEIKGNESMNDLVITQSTT